MTTLEVSGGGGTATAPLEVVPRRRVGRWIGTVLVVLFAVWIAVQLVTNDAFEWDVVGDYMFHERVLEGLRTTIVLTVLVMAIGIALGVPIAIMRLSTSPILRSLSAAFVWFFRGTPALVQLIFWFNLALLYPRLSIGIPFGGPVLFDSEANAVMTSMVAAMLGLGLNEAGYMAEIVRGGILAVDQGQIQAASSVGMAPVMTMRRIVLPQAMRAIIPPTGNQTIGMLKYTSLASVVALNELLHSVQSVYNRTYQIIPLLIVASIWYLILTTILSIAQHYIERHFGRGYGAVRYRKGASEGSEPMPGELASSATGGAPR